ncbi:MAG: hypothetical protein N3F08_03765 [Crenarchaeota archaeon]|nr:hypothetical protein [Thermoproteota archaeon]
MRTCLEESPCTIILATISTWDPSLVKHVFRHLSQYFSRIVETYLKLGVDGLWV